jgi:lysyl-tRNA synthetase class 2
MPLERNDQVQARIDKLEKIKALGKNPYPYKYEQTHSTEQLKDQQESLLADNTHVACAGRVVRFNRKGKMTFLHLKDDFGRIQAVIMRDQVGEDNYEVVKLLDIGDWVGISGTMTVTNAGEYSIRANSVELLSKALRPLPIPKEKVEDGKKIIYDEFKDTETRYRQRYVDLALNDSVRDTFQKRFKIMQTIRAYLLEHGYMEVDTPVLQSIYGGASARPFTTHHNSQNMELYLRISNELFLKRCIVGGFSKVFEFSRNFRNEGMDKTHNPEFTVLEFYEAFSDYNDMMVHFENLYSRCAIAVNGTTKITYEGTEIDLKTPWRRLTMKDALKEYAQLDVDSLSDEELQQELSNREIELKGDYLRGLAIQELFEATCEEHLIQPTFIIDHPAESTPLCKVHREDDSLVERFEPYINGWEIGNAYSELNDPQVQRRLFEEQVERGRGGEEETHVMDEDFLRSMEYGMPPIGGVGIGIDRLTMLLTDSSSIKDVLLFPLMRPE